MEAVRPLVEAAVWLQTTAGVVADASIDSIRYAGPASGGAGGQAAGPPKLTNFLARACLGSKIPANANSFFSVGQSDGAGPSSGASGGKKASPGGGKRAAGNSGSGPMSWIQALEPPETRAGGRGRGWNSVSWQIGALLYSLVSGLPVKFDHGRPIFNANANWTAVSEEGKDIVACLLTTDPTKRMSPAKLLKHPFMQPPPGIASPTTAKKKLLVEAHRGMQALHSTLCYEQGVLAIRQLSRSQALAGMVKKHR